MAQSGYMYGPIVIYTAALGTSRPQYVTTAPSSSWVPFVSSDIAHYHEDGVSSTTTETYTVTYADGTPSPLNSRLSQQENRINAHIMDSSPDVMAKYNGFRTVTTVSAGSGVPGTQEFDIAKTSVLPERALLCRGASGPSGMAVELYAPRVVIHTPTIDMNFNKSTPVSVNVEFLSLLSSSGSVLVWRVQTAAPTS